jgi:CHAD domain-containing protein
VTAERVGSNEIPRTWREVEVELVDGPPELLDRIDAALRTAGCTPSSIGSKLARALGETAYGPLGSDEDPHLGPGATAKGSAREVLVAYLAEQVEQLQKHDPGVREAEPGSVHRMRIAARRMRSALVTYRPILDREAAEAVREELRWLGQSLGRARDAKVLRSHLHEVLAAQPAELVLGPVASRIDSNLAAEHQAGIENAVEALQSSRYYRLLDRLDGFVAGPPTTDDADEKAEQALPRLLRRDAKRLERTVAAVDRAAADRAPRDEAVAGKAAGDESAADQADRGAYDVALHEARKKAKRFRYAAESAVPVFGKPAKKLAKKAKRVQDTLGVHQDSVVAQQALREYAVQAQLAGENAFTFGRLHALEQHRGEAAVAQFDHQWCRLPRRRLRRVLRA